MRVITFIFCLFLSLPCFSQLYKFPAKLVRVIDGDTFWVKIKMPKTSGSGFTYKKIKIRVYSCDTYELKSRNPQDKVKAYEAKNFTNFVLSNYTFTVQWKDFDRYDRWVAKIDIKQTYTLKELLKQKGLLTGKYEHY